MKTNKELAAELFQKYKASLQNEKEQWELCRHHSRKWQESDCEDNGEYEKYQTALNEYMEIKRETDILARLVLEYEFREVI